MSTFVSALTKERARGTYVPFAIVSTQDGLVVGTTRFLDLQFWPLPGGTNADPSLRSQRSAAPGSPPLPRATGRTGRSSC